MIRLAMWSIVPREIVDAPGGPSGGWRLTATSDHAGGGPYWDNAHAGHASAEEARACLDCRSFCARVTGLPINEPAITPAQLRDLVADGRRLLLLLQQLAPAGYDWNADPWALRFTIGRHLERVTAAIGAP